MYVYIYIIYMRIYAYIYVYIYIYIHIYTYINIYILYSPDLLYEVSFSWGWSVFKSSILLCMEYCCRVWPGAPKCFLELLYKLQKQICRTDGPSLAASLEPLGQWWNVISLSFSVGITLVYVHLKWLNWFHFLIPEGGLIVFPMFMSTVSSLAQLSSGILCL